MFVLVLDDLNTSFSRSARVKLAARQFIERYLGANDVAAIVQTGGAKATGPGVHRAATSGCSAPSTTSWARRSARRRSVGSTNTTGRSESAQSGRPRDPNEEIRVYKARNTYTRPQERRRLHGRHPRPPQGGRLLQRRRRLRHLRSDRQHVRDRHPAVQPGRDCRRHARQRQLLQHRPARTDRFRRCRGDWFHSERPVAGPRVSALQRELQISQDSLRTLSDETGGFAAVNSNDFAQELRAHHPRQQQLLRPRLLLERHQARRAVPQPDRSRQAARPPGARAQGLRRRQGAPARRNASARRYCRVGRDARGTRQSRARHRARP